MDPPAPDVNYILHACPMSPQNQNPGYEVYSGARNVGIARPLPLIFLGLNGRPRRDEIHNSDRKWEIRQQEGDPSPFFVCTRGPRHAGVLACRCTVGCRCAVGVVHSPWWSRHKAVSELNQARG
jgi:hypothetical protein